jgi:hypothetical protein
MVTVLLIVSLALDLVTQLTYRDADALTVVEHDFDLVLVLETETVFVPDYRVAIDQRLGRAHTVPGPGVAVLDIQPPESLPDGGCLALDHVNDFIIGHDASFRGFHLC